MKEERDEREGDFSLLVYQKNSVVDAITVITFPWVTTLLFIFTCRK